MKNQSELKFFDESRFIFSGRALRRGETNVRLLPVSDNLAIVIVDAVFRGDETTRGYAGTEVTVVLAASKDLELGKRYLFFTNVFLYGESIAVREVGRLEPAADQDARTIADRIAEIERSSAEKILKEKTSAAELVVVGRIIGLRGAPAESKVSTQGPDWWFATVQVSSIAKGPKDKKHAQPNLEVVFANSRLMPWRNTPKLRPGESGILILRKQKIRGLEGQSLVYPITDSLDFLPLNRLEDVKRAIGART